MSNEELHEEEELDRASLPDDELVQQMHDDLYDGLKEEIEEGTHILLDRGWGPVKLMNEALVAGMTIVPARPSAVGISASSEVSTTRSTLSRLSATDMRTS